MDVNHYSVQERIAVDIILILGEREEYCLLASLVLCTEISRTQASRQESS